MNVDPTGSESTSLHERVNLNIVQVKAQLLKQQALARQQGKVPPTKVNGQRYILCKCYGGGGVKQFKS